MNQLPPEILENIFKQIESIKDLKSISNTCLQWRNIAEKVLEIRLIPTKILVVGGYSNDTIPSGNFVEIIDLLRPKFKCKFFHEKSNLLAAVGGIISNQPVICGGFNATTYEKETKKCIVIGKSKITMEMLQLRQHEPSGVVIDSSKIWIVGIDTDSSLGLRKSATEFISLDEPHAVPGPQIPFAVHHHCMVQLDSKSIFIIGGYQNGVKSDKTWIVDPTNNYQVKEGPTMKTVKWVHSCAKMKIKEKTILVVVGNTLDGDLEDLVELLDTSVPDPKWTIGPKLPHFICKTSMVTSPMGNGVILIGGGGHRSGTRILEPKSALMELSGHSMETLKWSILSQRLQHAREWPISIPITDEVYHNLIRDIPNVEKIDK